jgi:hypothetical protein
MGNTAGVSKGLRESEDCVVGCNGWGTADGFKGNERKVDCVCEGVRGGRI